MSRVKLPLHYPSLNDMQRATIWHKTLRTEDVASSWDFERCQYYGKMYKRNGRDIFNLLDTAVALAKQRTMDLTEELVQETYRLMFRDRDHIEKESTI
jgi:chromosomal replication initiation ATPase DnaA